MTSVSGGPGKRVVFAGTSAEAAAKIGEVAGGQVSRSELGRLALPENLARLRSQVGALFMEVSADNQQQELEQCAAITKAGVHVVMVAADAPQMALAAVRAGCVDIVGTDAPASEYLQAVARVAEAQRVAAQGPVEVMEVAEGERKVVVVFSPNGGVGKTTVATNLAAGLAQIEPNHTVLVDLNVLFGDVTTALNIQPKYTLPDMTAAAMAQDALVLKSFLSRHESGMYVVGGSDSPTDASAVTAEMARAVIEVLASSFKYVVIDTDRGLSVETLTAIEMATDLVAVTRLDVGAVRGMRRGLAALAELGMTPPSMHVVVNFGDPRRGLTVADVVANIKAPVNVQIPVSKSLPLSLNQGTPLVLSSPNDPAAKPLNQLVERIAGGAPVVPVKKSLFGRLAK